ncbi:DUF2141 domain-containing protein [Pseudoxanthomonas sacheonensis]|uniref:Uncharacterized protein (DUF2141 family) n=1 Tax=Pseudoxanthomonas sacheonensis TaxID=443615 RepID=A0ABU1RSL3_9GAMM|nr:DUF2141 domain-containing protein [Pseudoxanthomonas sacheonensis]MDR6841777.1 uncharacterized protein (DUF2141 family) [Pseudoxanthomonas sacheonensis]
MNRIRAPHIVSLVRTAIGLALLAGGPAFAGDLTVKLHGVRAQTGLIKAAVVDSQEAWNGKAAPVQADGVPAQADEASFTFKDLKPGSYAVMITHDENGNGKLDTNVLGMPLEGYGFSNNPQVMRKPTWDEARFEITATGAAIDIDLR